jgi:hypothetical protein
MQGDEPTFVNQPIAETVPDTQPSFHFRAALPKERVDKLETLLKRFEPLDTFQRYGWLFAHHVRLPE